MKFLSNILILFFLFSCIKDQKKVSNSIKKNDTIVIIFGERTYKKDTLFLNKKSYSLKKIPSLTYVRQYPYEKLNISINNINKKDTLIIKSDSQIVLEHRYHYYYSSSYLFNPGDTIEFKYVDDAPFCKKLNKKDLYGLLNFEVNYNLSNKIYKNDTEFYFKNKVRRTETEKKKYYKELKENRLKQLSELNSFIERKDIKNDYYSFLKNKINYQINILTQEAASLNSNMINFKDSSLLKINSYRHFIINNALQKFKIPLIKNGSMNIINSKVAFDSVQKSTIYSKKNKNFLMYTFLKKIANDFSIDDFNKYYNNFNNIVEDTVLKKNLSDKYLTDLTSLKKSTNEVHLLNTRTEKTTLKKLIEKNYGKVIYIDFWASWCTPCREAMSDSRELQNLYKDKNVTFIFISIDKGFQEWEKAAKQENLQLNNNSFFAINYPSAIFYKELSLKTIPRYLLYDTKGKLIHKNAPSPTVNEITKLIEQYIE